MEGITMTYTNRRDFLKTVTATAVLTAIPPVQAKETPTMSKENFADVNGQHIFYSVHGAGKPLILLHGGINPDSFGSNLAELAKGRQVIAVHLQAHGRTPDTDRPLRCETMGDDVAALIGHLKLGKADVMGYSLGSFVALQTALRDPDAVDRLVLMAARMRQDDAYPEVVAAFNQLEANAAAEHGSVGLQLIESRHHLRISVVLPHPRGHEHEPVDRVRIAEGGLQRDEGAQRVAHHVGLAEFQMADQSGNVVAHRFTAQWPVGVWRAPMRLKMDGDHLPALGQFGQIAPEAVWVDAPVKKNERLAGAMHAVKD